jgi:Cytochrome c554 and c-prime
MNVRLPRPVLGLLLLAVAFACRREPSVTGPLDPHLAATLPLPLAPPPVVRSPAPPAPPARPRPALALMYSSNLRGRVTATPSPTARKLPPGVGLSPVAYHETVGGLARRATIVDQARLDAAAVVQVDAGDFLPLPTDEPRDAAALAAKGDAKADARWRDLVLASYKRLGVDVVTLGERELAQPGLDVRRLGAQLQAAHLSVVLANLVDRRHARVFEADTLVDAAGVSVGVFGVTELDAAAKAQLAKTGYALTSAEDAAKESAKTLRARGAKLVVALVHAAAGRARATAIAAASPDVDIVVVSLGHDAAGAPPGPARPARPHIAAVDGDAVGRLDVRMAPPAAPQLSDRVVTLPEKVPEQLGVGLLTRTITIPTIDSDKLLAESQRKHKNRAASMGEIWEPWTYASTEACSFCHPKEIAQWKTTDHADALATLTKAKHGRDPACVGCHTMGFLQAGGTHDMVMTLGGFANVGCESCHGGSAIHVRSTDKKKGTSEHVEPILCLGCHTPDQNRGPFDPIAAMKEIVGPGHGLPAP